MIERLALVQICTTLHAVVSMMFNLLQLGHAATDPWREIEPAATIGLRSSQRNLYQDLLTRIMVV